MAMTRMSHETGCKAANADFRLPARAGYLLILMSFGVCGLWAAQAPLDSAAVAPGQIEVDSRRKAIQHLEGGIIKEILVKESQIVERDQVLFRLEPTQARANSEMLRKQFDATLAQEARLLAERDGKSEIFFDDVREQRRDRETESAITDEQRQFVERRQSLDNQVHVLEARLEQTVHQMTGGARQKAALTAQVESITGQLAAVRAIAEQGLYPRNRILEQEREQARLVGNLGQTDADMARMEKQLEETQLQIEQLRQKFREDASHDLADTRNRLSDLREKLAVADDLLTRTDIRAPMAGTVQNLRINGAGAVVKAGDTVADLIPVGEELVVAAQVSPLDIDSVATGQKAEIRFTSLSRRQSPTAFGQVQSISADAILNETTKQSYYLARVVINRADVPAAVSTKLTSGMPADVLIVTGERSALDYLVGPLRNALSKGMREE
jgi:HlyD family secretion protein